RKATGCEICVMMGLSARLLSIDVWSEGRVWIPETGGLFVSLSDYVKSDGWGGLSPVAARLSNPTGLAEASPKSRMQAEEIEPPKPDFVPEPDAPTVPEPDTPT